MKLQRLLNSLLAGCLILSFVAGCAPASASSEAAGAPTATACAPDSGTLVPCTVGEAAAGALSGATLPGAAGSNPPGPQASNPGSTPTPAPSATPAPTATPSATVSATAAPSATPTPLPPTATPCAPGLCSYSFQYFLQRPIAPENNDRVDATYRFGTSQGGKREPHHGVEFLNGQSTPVLAAADGKVVFAGADAEPLPAVQTPAASETPAVSATSAAVELPAVSAASAVSGASAAFLGMFASFYGNVVVIEHQVPPAMQAAFPDMPLPLYTLYAHLSEVEVETGQQVRAGQQIGKVGMTGVAEGSHLHFEVRLGDLLYNSVRNPELYLAPHSGLDGQPNGGIAGSIVDAQGAPIELENSLVLVHLPQGPDGPNGLEVYLQDYEEPALVGQPPYTDSFAVGDIPPGWYRLSFPHNGLQEHLIEVFPGQLTWFRLVVE